MASERKHTGHSSLGRRALRGLMVGAGASILRLILQLSLQAILARIIAPEHFGVIALAILSISFAERIIPLGINLALTQSNDASIEQYQTAATVLFSVSIAVAGSYFLVAPSLASFFGVPALVDIINTLCILFPLKILTKIHISYLQRKLRFNVLAAAQLGSYLIGYCVTSLIFASMNSGVWALVFALVAQTVCLYGFVSIPSSLPLKPRFRWNEAVTIIRLGGGFLLATLGNFFALQVDNIIIGRYFPTAVLGFYSRAYQITTLPATLFDSAVQQVLFPSLAKLQNDKARLRSAFLRGSALIATFSFVGSGSLFLLAPDFIRVMMGPDWGAAIPLLQILSLSLGQRTCYKIADTISASSGAVYRRALLHWLYAGLIAAGALIGSNWGINGIAVGVTLAITGAYLMAHWLCLQVLELSFSDLAKIHGPAILLSVVLTIPAAFLTKLCHDLALPSVVTILAVFIFTAIGLLVAFRLQFGFSAHFIKGIHSLRAAVKSKRA